MVELLVVIAVIGILSSVVILNLGSMKQKANIARGKTFSASIHQKAGIDCLGAWDFDEGSGSVAKDASGFGNDGTISGAAFAQETPEGNNISGHYGLQFNSGNYINMGNPESLKTINELTVEAWAKFSGIDYTQSTGKLVAIAAKGAPDSAGPNSGWWFTYDNRNNRNNFAYACFGNSNGGWAGGGNNFSAYSYNFNNGIWYHLAITANSSEARLYINGNQIGAPKTLSNVVLSNSTNNFYVGAYGGGSATFQGTMDAVRVYGQSLSSSQIRGRYLAGLEKLQASGQIPNNKYHKKISEMNGDYAISK